MSIPAPAPNLVKLSCSNMLEFYVWGYKLKSYEKHVTSTGCFFTLGLPLKVPSTNKLIYARLGVSRTTYVNVDSPNLGFPYLNFLGGYQLKKHPVCFFSSISFFFYFFMCEVIAHQKAGEAFGRLCFFLFLRPSSRSWDFPSSCRPAGCRVALNFSHKTVCFERRV